MVLCDFIRVDNILSTASAHLLGDHNRNTMIKYCNLHHKVIRKLVDTVSSFHSDSDGSSCGSSDHQKVRITWKTWKLSLTVTGRELVNFCAIREHDRVVVWAQPQDKKNIIGASSRQALDEFARDNFDVLMYYYSYRYFKDVEPEFGGNPVLMDV